jgi:hypothetical protein
MRVIAVIKRCDRRSCSTSANFDPLAAILPRPVDGGYVFLRKMWLYLCLEEAGILRPNDAFWHDWAFS